MVKNLPGNIGDTRDAGSSPGSGRTPGEGNGNLLQYSCLQNPMDRGAWWLQSMRWHRVERDCESQSLYSPWNSPGQNTAVGSLSLLQGIFPIQGSNPGFPHCRWILYHLSHQGSPRILEWVAYPFSRGSS